MVNSLKIIILCDAGFGIFTPARHDLKTFLKYDIGYFNDNIRFLNIMGAREGSGGVIVPLYFDGAVNFFKELPRVEDAYQMQAVYNLIASIRGRDPITYTIP